jgi:hypothetical protein
VPAETQQPQPLATHKESPGGADQQRKPPVHHSSHSFDHRGDQVHLQSLTMGVEKVLHDSHEMICQARALHVRTMALLKQLDETWSRDHTEILEQAAFLRANPGPALNWVIDAALRTTHADMTNIQLVDPSSGDLYIAAHHGFSQPFLDFFDRVHEGNAACGTALQRRGTVMVEDVTQSPIFWGTSALEVLLDARVRAVQSSPLISASGATLGVLSTHWTSPRRLSNQEARQLNLLTRTFANCLQGHEYL